MMLILTIIFMMFLFAVSYAIKGGQLGAVLTNTAEVRAESKILDRLLDGKVLSTLLVLIGVSFYTVFAQVNLGIMPQAWGSVIWIGVLWLLAVSPSMGEEYGSIMGKPYGDGFDREYGIKKALQRGVWIGACMTMATGSIWFIPASLLFVPLAFIALNYIKGRFLMLDPWAWSEVLIGAIVFGVPMAYHAISIQQAL